MKRGIDFLGNARKQYAIDRIALIRRPRHAARHRECFDGRCIVKYENTAFHAATKKIEKRHCSPPRLILAMPNALHQRLTKKRREATLLASPLHVRVRRHLILASISKLTV